MINLQGQCGNQVGEQFWSQLCQEHRIQVDGMPISQDEGEYRNDRPGVFFSQGSTGRYTPRAILIDLEPRVINSIRNKTNDSLFDPKNCYVSSEGGGAANRWAEGYMNAVHNKEEVLDMINRQLDGCDNCEGFQLLHSVAGGTGSGFGSFLLEELSDNFPKKLVQTYSVFGASEVVVQPYNTVLTLKRLIEQTDANIIVDNQSLMSIASKSLQLLSPSFKDANKLISTVMSAATNTLRFPGYSYNNLTSILSTLVPTPDLHFLVPSYTPFLPDDLSRAVAKKIRSSTAYDVILEVLDKKLRMCSNSTNAGTNISVFDIILGQRNTIASQAESIQRALMKAKDRINFAPWSSSAIHVAFGSKPGVDAGKSSVQEDSMSGLMLANSTSVVPLLVKIANQYDQLMRRSAFLNKYVNSDYDTEIGDIMAEFSDCREVLQEQIDEYSRSETIEYIQESGDEDIEENAKDGSTANNKIPSESEKQAPITNDPDTSNVSNHSNTEDANENVADETGQGEKEDVDMQ